MKSNSIKLLLVVLIAGFALQTTATALARNSAEDNDIWGAIGAMFTTSAHAPVALSEPAVMAQDEAETQEAEKLAKAEESVQEETAKKTTEAKVQIARAAKHAQEAHLASSGVPRAIYQGVVTAYSSSVDETDSTPFITASNQRVRHGIVANNCLPFGTKVKISGQEGVYEVQDRMNSRYGCTHFDMWKPSKWEARQYGKRYVRVEVL